MVVICTVGASYGKVPTEDLGGVLQLASGIQEPKPECFSKGELALPGNAQVLRLSVCQTDTQGAPQGGICPCWCWSTAREILPYGSNRLWRSSLVCCERVKSSSEAEQAALTCSGVLKRAKRNPTLAIVFLS